MLSFDRALQLSNEAGGPKPRRPHHRPSVDAQGFPLSSPASSTLSPNFPLSTSPPQGQDSLHSLDALVRASILFSIFSCY